MRTTGKTLGIAVLTLAFAMGGRPLEAGAPSARLVEGYGRRPLAFEENRGQTDQRVRFLARGDGYGLFLTASEAVLALREKGSEHAVRLRWVGASPAPRISGESELPGRSHYLVGNDRSKWRTGITSYEKVRYQDVYPGIDLVFYGNPQQLEYDFVLAPGADPRAIRFAVEGADRMEIESAGDLILHLGGGEVRLKKPVAYQEIGGVRKEVGSGWRLLTGDGIGFQIASYDPERPLVIDPVLSYSTYLGGSGQEEGDAIAVDAERNAYVTGITTSPDFPIAGAPQSVVRGFDAFVTKLDAAGNLVYSTYLGGSGTDQGKGIAVDASGAVYVGGRTDSSDFPLVSPLPPQLRGGGQMDAFVTKLDPNGSALLYSTRLGGTGREEGWDLDIDPQGHAYVTGYTNSDDFPTVNPLSPTRTGDDDAFVAKLSPEGSSLVYSTYLGGSNTDWGLTIAVAAGHAHVAGFTQSPNFPTINPLQPFPRGTTDGFVAKLDPSGSSLVYSTYLSGRLGSALLDIAVDDTGAAYVTGAAEGVLAAKIAPAGAAVYILRLTTGDEGGLGIAVDSSGSAYITGFTRSPDFPIKNPIKAECLPSRSCFQDAFVLKLNPAGTEFVYSTFLGGTDTFPTIERGEDIAVDLQGNAYVTGVTRSFDFPVVNAFQPTYGGGFSDAFVVKIAENRPPVCSAAFASPATLWPPSGKLVPVAIQGVTDPDGDPVTVTVTAIRQDEPPGRQGPDAAGTGTPNASVRSDRAGGGDGRVYHLTFTASDGQGGICTGTVRVCVPHDQGRRRACGDGGALFDSTVAGR